MVLLWLARGGLDAEALRPREAPPCDDAGLSDRNPSVAAAPTTWAARLNGEAVADSKSCWPLAARSRAMRSVSLRSISVTAEGMEEYLWERRGVTHTHGFLVDTAHQPRTMHSCGAQG